jgi:hypothetical protein
MAKKDFCFLFYPGDYLRDTQCFSEKTQVSYDRIMCEHMRNMCITQQQLKFFTKRLNDDEREELMTCLIPINGGFQIQWVAESIEKRIAYGESRSKNKKGKGANTSKSYDIHMERESEKEIEGVVKDYNIEELKDYLHAELPELGLDAPLVSSMQFDLIDSFISECEVFQKLAIWKTYVERIKKSDWLMRRTTGKGQKKTKLSLKWLCKAESFTSVMAGNHDNVETVSDGREFI